MTRARPHLARKMRREWERQVEQLACPVWLARPEKSLWLCSPTAKSTLLGGPGFCPIE